jgi:pimeloyl-ACP methyl ester carboxylesterase
MKKTKSIILIHGNFVNNHTWSEWKEYYEQKGYTVYAPANPGHNGNPAELRENINADLVNTGLIEIVENIESLIDSLPEKPLVIGHSLAGLAVMKLMELGKIDYGVSISGAPPKNVAPAPLQTLKTVFPALQLFSSKKYYLGSQKWYNNAFFNTISENAQKIAFEKYAVPESTKVTWDGLQISFAKVDFRKSHAPMLFIGGGNDHIFPPNFIKKIAGKYSSPVDLKIFEGKSHFICGEPGWENVADYVLDWYEKQ